jgi:hypothetical protein
MSHDYVDRTERVGGLIVQVVADQQGFTGSPYRDQDQTSEVFGKYDGLDIDEPPREHLRILEAGGLRMLYRFMRRFGDPRDGSKLLAMKQLGVYDHSGITVWTEEIGSRKAHDFDPGGWDTSHVGYVLITKSRWDQMNGGDPEAMVDSEIKVGLGSIPVKMRAAEAVLDAEVEEWDDWMTGNVWGYVITKPCDHPEQHVHPRDVSKTPDDNLIADCPHSETVESCWGFIGDSKYAWEEARASAESQTA